MKSNSLFRKVALVATAVMLVGTISAWAQPPGPGGPMGGRGGRMGGPPDPERIWGFMSQRYQDELGFDGEEWEATEPLLKAVVTKQFEDRARGMRGMMRRGRRGPGGPGGEGRGERAERREQGDRPERPDRPERRDRMGRGGPEREAPPEVAALEEALENEETPAKEVKAKLKELRKARKEREAELEKARDALRDVLTVRQEARLVLMGVLD